MLLFGMSYICLQIFQLIGISHTHFLSYNPQNEGTRTVQKKLAYYNLDMILSIGYRVRSPKGIQFRQYVSTVLKDYLIKGFAVDYNPISVEAKSFFATVQNKRCILLYG